jgi:hypothetical protein
MQSEKFNLLNFINDTNKMEKLKNANDALHITNSNRDIIFVYTAPKVASTTIVTTLRIFASDKFDVIHIHDEEMLNVLTHIKDISVNELIFYNKYIGKTVYVIDIYRSPIERKISAYFEKIGSYHFNDKDENVNKYNINKIIFRFNKIFPYIALGDHFIDNYNIPIPEKFDTIKKCVLLEIHGVKYIKLRLKDSNLWGYILGQIFQINMVIVKDYETTNKPIKDIYNQFKDTYKIPINLLNEIMNCKYFNYYYSEEEKKEYYNEWIKKSCENFNYYTQEEYRLYNEITIENSHYDFIQTEHYLDEGCRCKACCIKRVDIARKLLKGFPVNERIIHTEAKNELIKQRVIQATKVNQNIKQTRSREFRNVFSRRNL